MHVSLAIATIGRRAELAHLLETLCNQTHKDFSVLICDQNPKGFLDETLEPFRQHLQITTIHHPPQGVSAARNVLFPYLKGDIVAFPDDDCWYTPDTLERVVEFFTQSPNVGSIMGVWNDSSQPLPTQHRAYKLNSYTLFEHGGTLVQFFRRGIVENVGTFDETLGPGTGLPYGCGEDTDYILRAQLLAPVWRVPNVHVHHSLPAMEQLDKEKVRAYAAGRMYLLRKHSLPIWFKLANVLFPLYTVLREGPSHFNYRWHMFMGRLLGLFQK